MSLKLRSPIIQAVQVVQIVDSFQKPEEYETISFFSEDDVWLYDATLDTKVCDLCRHYEEMGEIRGNHLRLEFPNWRILDENTIGGPEPDGKGLVHPNCRCVLKRLLTKHERVTPKGE